MIWVSFTTFNNSNMKFETWEIDVFSDHFQMAESWFQVCMHKPPPNLVEKFWVRIQLDFETSDRKFLDKIICSSIKAYFCGFCIVIFLCFEIVFEIDACLIFVYVLIFTNSLTDFSHRDREFSGISQFSHMRFGDFWN